ncbi:MAG: PKD domain-containing protein, partial [Pseudomonadota bacterium]
MICSTCETDKPVRPDSIFWSKRFLIAFAAILFALATTGVAGADDNDENNFVIKKAEWKAGDQELIVEGKGAGNLRVTVVNAFDTSQVFGQDDDWKVKAIRPSPVPCRVLATQSDGQMAEWDVKNAPSDCAPKDDTNPPPPPVNVAPTANANGPYSGTSGAAVNFSSAGSSDSDGAIAAYSWNFGDGGGSNNANPSHTYATAGNYSVSLTITDNDGATGTDTTTATINDPTPANAAPTANAGPDQSVTLAIGQSSIDVILDGSGSFDPDGAIASYTWTGTPDPADVVSPTISLGVGTYLFTLVLTDDLGMSSNPDTIQIIVNPFPTTAAEAHATITVYEGPSTCVACHDSQAVDMHGSVHYQQTGAAINLTNDVSSPDNPDGLAGERGNGAIGINTYCGSHENSPRFTCAGCHVGNGRFPKPVLPMVEPARTEELSNIDCMMCHQEIYKRFPTGEFEPLNIVAFGADGKPDPTAAPIVQIGINGIPMVDPITLDFLFEPADEESLLAGSALMISRHEAARTVHATTRKACLNCHAGAG